VKAGSALLGMNGTIALCFRAPLRGANSSTHFPRGALRFPWAILTPSLREEDNEMAFGAERLN